MAIDNLNPPDPSSSQVIFLSFSLSIHYASSFLIFFTIPAMYFDLQLLFKVQKSKSERKIRRDLNCRTPILRLAPIIIEFYIWSEHHLHKREWLLNKALLNNKNKDKNIIYTKLYSFPWI